MQATVLLALLRGMAPSLAHLLLVVLSFCWLALTAPVDLEPRVLGLSVTLPSKDAFYQPPSGFENKAPGTILKSRQVAAPTVLELLAPGVTRAVWQLLYRSTDSSGNANAVVTTVFGPFDGDTNKLFTQSIAYDASDVDCSPVVHPAHHHQPTARLRRHCTGLVQRLVCAVARL